MQLSALVPLATFLATASAALVGSNGPIKCASETIASEGLTGKDNNVKFTTSRCNDAPHVAADGLVTKRQTTPIVDVCGTTCNTFCFSGSSGGPNAADCQVIADALLYDSQNVGALFNATASGTPTDKITMSYQSCLTYFLNQDPSTELEYCRSDWSSLVTWLSSDCNAANSAHGGLCVAADQRWYIQVQNTSG